MDTYLAVGVDAPDPKADTMLAEQAAPIFAR
jgi:hypothetical protein